MKINITIQGPAHNGFLNLDPTTQNNQTDRVICDLFKLEELIDANEAELILVNDVMDFLPLPARDKFLSSILTRVAHGGEIFLSGLDLYQVTRLIHTGEIASIQEANAILFGTNISKKSSVIPQNVIDVLQQSGQFDVTEVSFSGIQFVIKARRK